MNQTSRDRPPPSIRGDAPGSFAYHTLSHRLPAVVVSVIETDLTLDSVARSRLLGLANDLPNGTIRPLPPHLPDSEAWEALVEPYVGNRWTEVPFLFAEGYFYRRVLLAVGYFEHGRDPFLPQKEAALRTVRRTVPPSSLGMALEASLWGNQADLSLFAPGHEPLDRTLLIEDTPRIQRFVESKGHDRFDVIADNAGAELVADLLIARVLLLHNPEAEVYIHVKPEPTFVSDATMSDVAVTLQTFPNLIHPAIRHRLRIATHPFWGRPVGFQDLPPGLEAELSLAALTIVKGDANYRRLVDDRMWPPHTRMADVAPLAFPRPFAVLRTVKSEGVLDFGSDAERLTCSTPDWKTSGCFGVLQFID